MIKDPDTMRQSERFDYSAINIDYLRTLPVLQAWLKKNPHARTKIGVHPAYHNNQPPGHPKVLRYKPDNWRSNIAPVYVLPDPENFADVRVEYEKSKKYIPDLEWNHDTHTRDDDRGRKNKYYVLSPKDYKKLYKPLSWDNVRMQLWELDVYYYMNTQYKKDDGETYHDYHISKVYKPHIDEHWTESYQAEKWAEYHLKKAFEQSQIEQERALYVRIERNLAILHIKKWFPNYQPNLALLKNPKSSPLWEELDPYRWFYCYASKEDMDNDPIFRIHHGIKPYSEKERHQI